MPWRGVCDVPLMRKWYAVNEDVVCRGGRCDMPWTVSYGVWQDADRNIVAQHAPAQDIVPAVLSCYATMVVYYI